MAKRVKVAVGLPTVNTLEEADAILAEIAARKRNIVLIKAGLEESVDALKKKAAAEIEPLVLEVKVLEQIIGRFAVAHRETLFAKVKSRMLFFGEIGFRASTKAALLNRTWTWERVLKALKESALGCVRTKEEVDKDALRGLKPEEMESVGVKLQKDDGFYYELKEETVGSEA
jgi:phage host-nuclease inhibitor protein Gam